MTRSAAARRDRVTVGVQRVTASPWPPSSHVRAFPAGRYGATEGALREPASVAEIVDNIGRNAKTSSSRSVRTGGSSGRSICHRGRRSALVVMVTLSRVAARTKSVESIQCN